jgi:hypothetical protein
MNNNINHYATLRRELECCWGSFSRISRQVRGTSLHDIFAHTSVAYEQKQHNIERNFLS